jgi:hypothetical protein
LYVIVAVIAPGPLGGIPIKAFPVIPVYRTFCDPTVAHPPAGRNPATDAQINVGDPAKMFPVGCCRPERSLTGAAAPNVLSGNTSR